MPASPAAIARRRDRQNARNAAARARQDARPFVGVDGEGIGRGAAHRYALFRMSSRELYADDRRLTTGELLRFITDHPDPADLLVAFAFDYDVSNILRDLEPDRLRQVMQLDTATREGEPEPHTIKGGAGWTWIRPGNGAAIYGVQYIPRNYLRVCRGLSARWRKGWRTYAMPGTSRTIYDTWGFFQGTFLAALNRWEIGAEHWPAIKAGKDARSTFEAITPDIRRYCEIECDLLADMMAEFRTACLGAGIRPRTWNGAGKLAAALMKAHGVIRRRDLEARVPAGLLKMANEAYYGGRFEVTRCGLVDRTVHEHDINSAYPASMRSLPCLEHGTWRRATGAELVRSRGLYVAECSFDHGPGAFLCGLPFRSSKDGRLSWPRLGRGVYWSPEIRSARGLGAAVRIGAGWLYERKCKCKPFAWIEALYETRRQLGKDKRGQPLKLGYNSVYGKWAQRIGNPPYANPIYAGLCTALTRATLNEAIAAAGPRNVIMLATDAIYTVGRRPPLARGDRLGQWEHKVHRSLFIVRPGLYWPPRPRTKAWSLKTRGLSLKFFEKMTGTFRRAWAGYYRRAKRRAWVDVFSPIIPVTVESFVGLRLAVHLNKPDLACQWLKHPLKIKFECDSGGKRGRHRWHGKCVILAPRVGDDRARSATYQAGKVLATAGPWNEERLFLEALPDPLDLSPPFVE
jgi:DNA polymerase type B, organellar and viral